jgi:hypothetical protein
MFCCYFLLILYQWITEDLLIDKDQFEIEIENMIELQPITVAPGIVPIITPVPIAAPTITALVCDDPKELVVELSPPSTPPTTRLRKQIQAEEEFYKEDFEIIDISMINTEKKE